MATLQLEVLCEDGEHIGYSFAVLCVIRYAQMQYDARAMIRRREAMHEATCSAPKIPASSGALIKLPLAALIYMCWIL